jgi:hypothetical protein
MSYFDEARARAERRKSPWNLLLIPAVVGPWVVVSALSAFELGKLHAFLHPGPALAILPRGLSGILIAVAPLFAWAAPSMIAGNFLVAAVTPARRTLEDESTSIPDGDLSSSNKGLLKASLLLAPAALLLALLGAVIP